DRVDDVPRRVRGPALRLRSAARAARAFGLPERDRDVHLLDPADQAQPPRSAGGPAGAWLPSGVARLRGRVLRILRRLVRDHAGGGAVLDAGAPALRAFCSVRSHVQRSVRGCVAARLDVLTSGRVVELTTDGFKP